jgi:hypothetical protein
MSISPLRRVFLCRSNQYLAQDNAPGVDGKGHCRQMVALARACQAMAGIDGKEGTMG